MKKIKFSVLMSVYYKEKAANLEMALNSILEQTYMPSEIVLVEDGKLTKELYDVIEKYEMENKIIKVVKLEKNMGLGKALNIGMDNCKYEYVARMDSDDYSLPYRFEKQFKFIEENPTYSVIGSNIIEFGDLTNKNISMKNVPQTYDEILKYSRRRNPMNHMTVVFKKNDVKEVGGYLDCTLFEDYYLWMRMLLHKKKMFNIQEPLLRARSGLNLSSRRGSVNYISCIYNFEKKLLKMHMINFFDFCCNMILRSVVAILPNRLRYYFYQKKLRENKIEK